jgi:hypothetical protein
MKFPCASWSLYQNLKLISLEYTAEVEPTETACAVAVWVVRVCAWDRQTERESGVFNDTFSIETIQHRIVRYINVELERIW